MTRHVHGCAGDCDAGRECWRITCVTPEDAARRGVALLTEEQCRRLCAGEEDWDVVECGA